MKENTDAMATLGPIKSGKDTLKGEGTFYGVAVGADAIWVTCQGDDSKGWVAKAEIKDATSSELKLGELKPLIQTKTVTETAIPTGDHLHSRRQGTRRRARWATPIPTTADSMLAFYDPTNGSLKRKLKAGLRDLTRSGLQPEDPHALRHRLRLRNRPTTADCSR